jgi:hypothetical protein
VSLTHRRLNRVEIIIHRQSLVLWHGAALVIEVRIVHRDLLHNVAHFPTSSSPCSSVARFHLFVGLLAKLG